MGQAAAAKGDNTVITPLDRCSGAHWNANSPSFSSSLHSGTFTLFWCFLFSAAAHCLLPVFSLQTKKKHKLQGQGRFPDPFLAGGLHTAKQRQDKIEEMNQN